ncbi:MAG: hypothetical protein JNM07_09250 [Phycisphaerae bacterium]|nr:hypothetical protein [Phycisphaerae bacterium]
MFAFSLLAAHLCVTASTPPAAPEGDPRAVALMRAFEALDSSIEVLRWRQVQYSPPAASLDNNQYWLAEESEYWVASDGTHRFQHTYSGMFEDTREWLHIAENYGGTRTRQVGWYFPDSSGSIKDSAHVVAAGPGPLRLFGRFIDYAIPYRSVTLTEQVRRAKDVQYLEPTSEEPWPGFRVNGQVNGGWLDVEMRVDPDHGFTPRLFRTIRHHDQWPIETLVALEVTPVGPFWLPARIVQGTTYLQKVEDVLDPLPAHHVKNIALARAMTGLPEELKSPSLAAWIERMTEVRIFNEETRVMFGPLSCFDSDNETAGPGIGVLAGYAVNEPLHESDLFEGFPPGGRIFNGCISRHVTVEQARHFWGLLASPTWGGEVSPEGSNP